LGSGARLPESQNNRRGGALNSTTASVAVTGNVLPARTNHGTPAQRHDSMVNLQAMNVSVSDPGCTPFSSA
jgi:hypothetical protein